MGTWERLQPPAFPPPQDVGGVPLGSSAALAPSRILRSSCVRSFQTYLSVPFSGLGPTWKPDPVDLSWLGVGVWGAGQCETSGESNFVLRLNKQVKLTKDNLQLQRPQLRTFHIDKLIHLQGALQINGSQPSIPRKG